MVLTEAGWEAFLKHLITEIKHEVIIEASVGNACSCSHVPSTVSNDSCKAPSSDAIFLSIFSSAKKRRPYPADSALQVHGEIALLTQTLSWKRSKTLDLTLTITCHHLSRMQTWPACSVQVLLGTWRTWAWLSPMSPVPVLSSSSSCLHSNSSTSGPHR